MKQPHALRIFQHLSLALLCAGLAMPASATPPLQDRFILGSNQGYIVPSACCWMPVPESMRLLELKLNEACTAIGGPVGVFEQREGKLWLTGFETCGREIALGEVYAGREEPALADWLSGTFTTRLGVPCRAFGGRPVLALEQKLTVDEGVVTEVTEKYLDHSACRNHAE
jgi:hypothetical protein